jgi:uncharacterized protein YcbX
MGHIEQLFVHPIKSLDPVDVASARIVTGGGLSWDRRYAMLDGDGEYVNGKREPQVHRIRSAFDLDAGTVTVREQGDDARRLFHLDDDRKALEAWLGDAVGYPIHLARDDEGGYPDDTDASGPTVITAGTVETVASWYDGIDPAEMRRRLRPNVVVGGVEPFWEDRLYREPGTIVPFDVGGVRLHGVNPCQRCVVPTRDPNTGDPTPGFRETFVERRRATLPEWAGTAWFDHYFRLMANTRVPEASRGEQLVVGDEVSEPGEPLSPTQ